LQLQNLKSPDGAHIAPINLNKNKQLVLIALKPKHQIVISVSEITAGSQSDVADVVKLSFILQNKQLPNHFGYSSLVLMLKSACLLHFAIKSNWTRE
jgi:hypothetical protein